MKTFAAAALLALTLSGCTTAGRHPAGSVEPTRNPTASATPNHVVDPATDQQVFDVTTAGGPGRVLRAGQVALGTEVPWNQVGPGWRLTLLLRGHQEAETFPVSAQMLDLISPDGGRYQLLKVSTRDGVQPWQLDDWSADGRTALLSHGDTGKYSIVTAVDLPTGAQRSLRLAYEYGALLRTDGTGIWATDAVSRVRSITWGGDVTPYDVPPTLLQARDGRIIASGRGPITVLDPDGRTRTLPAPARSCHATRFWKPGVALTDCSGRRGPRVAALPLDGGEPSWISVPHGKNANDLGAFDAYRLDGTTYVQVAGACGDTFLGRQNADGSLTDVDPPEAIGNVTMRGVAGHRLLVTHEASCEPPGPPVQVLASYDPVRQVERVLTRLPSDIRFGRILAFGEPAAAGW